MAVLAKSDIEILNQLIDDERGCYRIRLGSRVHYLTIPVGIFDEDTMCRPYLLIPKLPDLLPSDSAWITMIISRDEDSGLLTSTTSTDPLPEIRTAWHEQRVNVLSLERTRRLRSGVHEVSYNGSPAVAKIACFEWDVARIERETWAYEVLAKHSDEGTAPVAPTFLGHLTENSRVMGFLLEKVEGREPACVDDLAGCEALLSRLHRRVGLVHGDVNRYNFLVDRGSGSVGGMRLVDFEYAEEFEEGLARAELLSLPAELAEETGRGSTVTL
ncbi:alpha-galactosidase A [Coniochaeta sp. 2T2.1]|nr:alpha-galactosidase A [Coniochaeta sp. 2T2.1]